MAVCGYRVAVICLHRSLYGQIFCCIHDYMRAIFLIVFFFFAILNHFVLIRVRLTFIFISSFRTFSNQMVARSYGRTVRLRFCFTSM